MTKLTIKGVTVAKGCLNRQAQKKLVKEIRQVVTVAPLFSPLTPWGKPMRVKMTSAGKYGWYSDKRGYRYEKQHPEGGNWADLPDTVLSIWHDLVSPDKDPDCCLVNFYGENTRMGLHQDKDESDFSWPVLSVSLGDAALFRIGGTSRTDPTESVWLESGDVAILGGDARLAFHGIDRIKFGSSSLLPKGGRINLTCRVVD